jgi:hypothetical protein
MNKEAKTMSRSAETPALSDNPDTGVILPVIAGITGLVLVVAGFFFLVFP